MSQVLFTSIAAALLVTVLSMPAQAQQRPQIETNKVDVLTTSTSSATVTINRCSWSLRTA
jgi:phage terminase Nu1 subunit (DNA packaging protein)